MSGGKAHRTADNSPYGESDPESHSNDPLKDKPKEPDPSNWQIVARPHSSIPGLSDYDPDEDWSEGRQALGLVFSTRRPRDVLAGVSSGLKSVAKGVGLGVASLLGAPVLGAQQEGLGGFFKGLGAGVIMAIAMPITGVGIGVAQITRGAFNTPEAVTERFAGRKWDKKNRIWKENWYSLSAEAEDIKSEGVAVEEQKKEFRKAKSAASGSTGEGRRSGDVKDTTYYELLGLSPDVSQSEIRKSYYKLARECHPDKNPDDPNAQLKFQALGEAYQILGDESRRAAYDEHGKDVKQGVPLIDSGLFFTMLFGSEKLEPYIGKLKLAMFIESLESSEIAGKIMEEVMDFEQRRREVQLALLLRDRVDGYVTGNDEKRKVWAAKLSEEASDLCKYSFGDPIVEAVGWCYENYSYQFLGKLDSFMGLGGKYAKFQARGREMGNYWKTAGVAVKVSLASKRLSKFEEKSEKATTTTTEEKTKRSASKVPTGKDGDGAFSSAVSSSASSASTMPPASGESCKPPSEDAGPFSTDASNPGVTNPNVSEKPGVQTEEGPSETFDPQEAEKEMKNREAEAKQLEETVPLILETMLRICLIDVEFTVRRACKKILKDLATPVDVRRLRAEAVMEMGQIFRKAAEDYKKAHKGDKLDAIRQMEEALIRAAAEADVEEVKKRQHGSSGDSVTPEEES